MNERDRATDKAGTHKDQQRKAYTPPTLQCFGKIKEVTLGGSLGLGDSGAPTVQNFPM